MKKSTQTTAFILSVLCKSYKDAKLSVSDEVQAKTNALESLMKDKIQTEKEDSKQETA